MPKAFENGQTKALLNGWIHREIALHIQLPQTNVVHVLQPVNVGAVTNQCLHGLGVIWSKRIAGACDDKLQLHPALISGGGESSQQVQVIFSGFHRANGKHCDGIACDLRLIHAPAFGKFTRQNGSLDKLLEANGTLDCCPKKCHQIVAAVLRYWQHQIVCGKLLHRDPVGICKVVWIDISHFPWNRIKKNGRAAQARQVSLRENALSLLGRSIERQLRHHKPIATGNRKREILPRRPRRWRWTIPL